MSQIDLATMWIGHQERQWLLELLLDGLKGSSDYRLYKKKGVLPLLMVLHESPFVNKKTKVSLIEYWVVYVLSCMCLFSLDTYSSFPAESMFNSICCYRPGVESWFFSMATGCHQLHFTVSTSTVYNIMDQTTPMCTSPHSIKPSSIQCSVYLFAHSSSSCRVQHCSPLLVNIVSVLQQTLSKCEYRREKNEREKDSSSGGCVTSLPKIPLLEEDMALVVRHLT